MAPLSTDMMLRADRSLVWATLADLEGVSTWNPSIDGAECTSEIRHGLGARRRCVMHPSGEMVESVTEWVPESSIAFTVDNAPPFKSAVGRFVLTDTEDATRLAATFTYEVRYGPLGPVIDRLVVHRQLASAWETGMAGLREHVEHLAGVDS